MLTADHCSCPVSHLLQVPAGSASDLCLSEDDLLSSTATQGADNAGKDLLLADQGGVLTYRTAAVAVSAA
jgi:hypothetical protein